MANILVTDDEELVRFTIREMLEAHGHVVSEAKDGNELIAHCNQHATDIVVTDIIMPEKEGIESIIELKQDRPEIKVLAISGGGRTKNMDFLDVAKQFGANGVLAKPFTEEELIEAINELLA